MIAKIDKNGHVEFYNIKTGGCVGRIDAIGKVIDASLSSNEEEVVITFERGDVDIYSVKTAGHKYSVAKSWEKAVRASFQGDNVVVTFANGSIELRTKTGSRSRSL